MPPAAASRWSRVCAQRRSRNSKTRATARGRERCACSWAQPSIVRRWLAVSRRLDGAHSGKHQAAHRRSQQAIAVGPLAQDPVGSVSRLLAGARRRQWSVLHRSDGVRHIRTEMVIHFALFQIGGLSGGIQLPRGVVLRFPHPERTWARKAPRTSSSPLLPSFLAL